MSAQPVFESVDTVSDFAALDARFARRLEVTSSGCIEWTGAISSMGYGNLSRGGKTLHAHRYGYELLVGPIPYGLVLDHLCRNRACVNPAHLDPVTQRVNLLRATTGVAFQNSVKVACPVGHAYDDRNTYRWANGSRRCRQCNADAKRRQRARIAGDAA